MSLSLYLSPLGRDTWSGRLPEPAPDGLDGPLASLAGARLALRRLKQAGPWPGPLTVWVAGGRYALREPVVFEPQDSLPVTFKALDGQTPIFDGGEPLVGWRAELVNGRAAWVTDVPIGWTFHSLFVYGPGDGPDGRRAVRARLPKVGVDLRIANNEVGKPGWQVTRGAPFYRMAGLPGLSLAELEALELGQGQDSFVAAEGDFASFHNLQDVEVVALHYWVEERLPVAGYDPRTRVVKSTRRSVFRLSDDAPQHYPRYYIDNVFEGLTEPGEWYLDGPAGRLYYLPLPGETQENTRVFAPRLAQFVRLEGDPAGAGWVEYLRFEGLTFTHGDWGQAPGGWPLLEGSGDHPQANYAADPQAAFSAPGAVALRGARAVAFENCRVLHAGGYAVEIGAGCRDISLSACTLSDLGAGGVHVDGASAAQLAQGASPALRTSQVRISDCTIAHAGRANHAGVGVLIRNASRCDVLHNHIFDLFYSGVSVGWVWGYAESAAYDNHIEHNHIHHLGYGWLSDMGGIYLLGVAPGTTVAGNWIHDIEAAHYGGRGIYPDEGSSHLIIENNICHDVSEMPFHQHYGRENIVRNNVFAFGQSGQVGLSRDNRREAAAQAGSWRAFTFSRNVLITANEPLYCGGYGADLRQRPFGSDLNLVYSVSGAPLIVAPRGKDDPANPPLSWEEWQALGPDRHSLVDDPGFVDIAARDFRLKPGARAREIGFVEIDLSEVGPRKAEAGVG